ncbi:MAG: hypothetical protein A2057_10725 [Ignavibacteria bacterium GWA2_35_9]|nr:MAG: hypothetical protein A2057_10725 [Ignavibacteria bacterium GWA2_35_9]OGU43960.1 MAG: hypothetical protein A2000_01025 [Ignavibacteria bacterium GWB2_36_8]OGU53771.1 MAG: hypothetical protein A2080_06105 [Ignavibacteria bacterium GWC2_36_12]
MQKIDKVILGDNQFFGINHMSQEKAQQLGERFRELKDIIAVYDYAVENGINAIMLNSNDRAKEICDYFRANKTRYSDISWYPSLPYPHKYANLVAEKGIVSAVNEVIFSDNSTKGLLSLVAKGSSALLGQDAVKIMQMLVDIEIKAFHDLNIKVIFLQNIITDLLLGLKAKIFFKEYADYIRKKYNVLPGFLTMNLPHLVKHFTEWGIEEVVICSSINKIGYLMSPDIKTYEETLKNIDKNKYQIMAMSVLASGAIPPEDAIQYITGQKVNSIVFGASSEKNIKETTQLINSYFN